MLPTALQQWHIPRHCLAFPHKNIAKTVHNNVFFWTCCIANSMENHTVFLLCMFCANHLMKNPFVAIHINPFWVSQISQQHQCTHLCLCDMWVNSSQCSVFFLLSSLHMGEKQFSLKYNLSMKTEWYLSDHICCLETVDRQHFFLWPNELHPEWEDRKEVWVFSCLKTDTCVEQKLWLWMSGPHPLYTNERIVFVKM